METETRAAFARRQKVQRSTVTKWEAKGLVVLTENGLVDVAATEERLSSRPQVYRGGRRKGPAEPNDFADQATTSSLDVQLDAFQLLIRQAGKIAAKSAVAAGAPMKVAHALELMIPTELAAFASEHVQVEAREAIRLSDWPFEGLGYGENEPDWAELAQEAREPFDMEAWESYLTELQIQGRA